MVTILALIFSILMLVKCVTFLIAPACVMDFINKFYNFIDKLGIYLQCGIAAFAVIMGLLISQLVGFYAMVAAGWFWCAVYGLFLMPTALNLHKKGYLKNIELDPDNKNKLLIACIFAICLSVLTIGLII